MVVREAERDRYRDKERERARGREKEREPEGERKRESQRERVEERERKRGKIDSTWFTVDNTAPGLPTKTKGQLCLPSRKLDCVHTNRWCQMKCTHRPTSHVGLYMYIW